jgi:hypothetical protein
MVKIGNKKGKKCWKPKVKKMRNVKKNGEQSRKN